MNSTTPQPNTRPQCQAGEQAGWAELLWLVARLEDRVYEQAAAARALERRLEELEDRLRELEDEDEQFPRNVALDTEAAERMALEWRLRTVERRIDTLDAGDGRFVSKWEVNMEATARKDLARRLEALESTIKESNGALGAQGKPEASVQGKIWDGAVSILGAFWDFLWPVLFALGFVFVVVYDAWELHQIFDQVQDALPPKG